MKDEDKELMRGFAAMFAMNGLLARGSEVSGLVRTSFKLADDFMDAFEPQEDGIAAIKPKKRYERKA